MTHYDIKRLALILAVEAEITGMKQSNNQLKTFYNEYDFKSKAQELRDLAYAHDEQL